MSDKSRWNACAAVFDEMVDACVLGLTSPDEAKTKELQFMEKVNELFAHCSVGSTSRELAHRANSTTDDISQLVQTANASTYSMRKTFLFIDQVREWVDEVIDPTTVGRVTPPAVSDIETSVSTANAPSHLIRKTLNRLESDFPDLFAVIRPEGKV